MLKVRTISWLVPLLIGCALRPAGAQEKMLAGAREKDAKAAALALAVQRDDLVAVNASLERGANANTADQYGVSPLMLACQNGNAGIVERLLKAGADPNGASPGGETALMTASRTGSAAAIKILVAHGAGVNVAERARGQTALMWAAANNNVDAMNALIDAGADVHARSHGPTAAPPPVDSKEPERESAYAARTRRGRLDSFTPLLFAVRDGALDAVRTLVDRGANVNDKVEDGTSALVIATMNANWELAAYLLDHGAAANANEQGWTALHQLIRTRGLSWGRLPHPVGSGSMTSMEFAASLIAHGADVNARMTAPFKADNERPRFVQVGATPFLLAAKNVDHQMMRVLLAHGADPMIKTGSKTTALMLAAGLQIFSMGEDSGTNEDALEAVKLCLEAGNDVNAVDDNGETALHGAAWRGANAIVTLLVEKGARLDARDKKGQFTPLAYAHLVYTPGMVFQSWPETEALLRRLMIERGLDTHVPTPEELRAVIYKQDPSAAKQELPAAKQDPPAR
ncbi:MAG TPA: ankyrin repeat domain-containing protein [Vicinamibacterales bacterium]|jgi:ankyrin repeat protein|nr:ankyrin repeat domain-containing protein [Vicinamibacterales bacterium]